MTDTTATETRDRYVRSTYEPNVAGYLLAGDGFRVDVSAPLGRHWRKMLDALVDAGLMRQSKSRRYWWKA